MKGMFAESDDKLFYVTSSTNALTSHGKQNKIKQKKSLKCESKQKTKNKTYFRL